MRVIERITDTDPTSPTFGQTVDVMGDDAATAPLILSKTAFNKYAAQQLGGFDIFQNIMDQCAASSGAVKFCFTQYNSALTFEKSEVDTFTGIMNSAGIMTSGQRAEILNNWPEA